MTKNITNDKIKKGYFTYPISDLIKHLKEMNKRYGKTHSIRIECDPYSQEGYLQAYKGKPESLDE